MFLNCVCGAELKRPFYAETVKWIPSVLRYTV